MAFEDYDSALGYSQGFEWDQNLITQLSEITVGKQEVDSIDIKHSLPDGKTVWKKMPGHAKPGEVTVKVHMSDKIKPILDEFKKVASGDIKGARKGAAIVVMDTMKKPVFRYELTNAWIKSIDFGSFKPFDNNPNTITVIFAHEGLEAKPA